MAGSAKISAQQLFDLSGRTAVVTGASSGLGVSFARALAAAGARVVLAARRKERLEDVAREIGSNGAHAVAMSCDVSDAGQVEALAAAVASQFGRTDILVNNAGVVSEAGMVPEKIPHAIFEQTVRVNLLGTWFGCQAFGQRMLADGKGGSIINLASIAGLGGVADFPPAYQATKAAVINLTRNLACSWGNRKVRVNALAPGWFPSEMTDGFFQIPGSMDWINQSAPLGRAGNPEELIGALLFFASDASSYVTGQTLAVDGGTSAAACGGAMPASVMKFFEENVPHGLGRRIGGV